MSALDIALVAGLAGCFLLAAALAVAEVSFIRVRRSHVLVQAERGDRRAQLLLGLLDDFPIVLNSVLLLVLSAQVAAATIAGYLAERWFGGVAVTVTSIVLTAVLFVYAEAVPKTIAVRSPEAWAHRLAPMLRTITALCRPIVKVLVALADVQSPGHDTMLGALTEEELRALTRESAEVGTIDEDDAELVDRSFEFGDLSVADVMVPRERIVCVDADAPARRVIAAAIASGHRRFPVSRGDVDQLVGVVRFRDIAAAGRATPGATVGEIMSELMRCRPEEPIADVLDRMQAGERWLAIATGADGRTLGLVTIEDIVAELVGEIADDHPTGS